MESEFYTKTLAFLTTISEEGKDWNWLFDQFQLSKNYRDSLRNGTKTPSGDLIYKTAFIIKEHGCNIFSPKQIMPLDFSISHTSMSVFSNNIAELCERYNISANEIYPKFAAKNTILSIIRKDRLGSHKILTKMFPFFQKYGISKVSDFVYYKAWGEEPFTFLEYRKKYKL